MHILERDIADRCVTHGITKKEFLALVNTQWKRLMQGKNKANKPKKIKDSNESSVTSIEPSNSEEREGK